MSRAASKNLFRLRFGSRARVTLLFLLGIGIPSLFLMFLAIRGIENDQALAEQQLTTEHRSIAGSLAAEFDRRIRDVEDALLAIVPEPAGNDDTDTRALFAGVSSSDLVDEIIVFRKNQVIYPLANLLYDTEASQRFGQPQSPPVELRRLLDDAETYEFRRRDYTRAGELYRAALRTARTDATRADLLMRIARVSAQSGARSDASEALRRVIDQFSTSRLPGGLPAGLAARLELAALAADGDTAGTDRQLLRETYRELLQGTWRLSKPQFRFVRSRIESLGHNIPDLSLAADSLESHTDYILDVVAAAAPLLPRLQQDEFWNGGTTRRVAMDGKKGELLLVLARAAAQGSDLQAVGAVISRTALTTRVLPETAGVLPLGDNTALVIRDAAWTVIHGTPPADESQRTLVQSFHESFPPWSIVLYQKDPAFFDRLLLSRRSSYVYALILVMIVLIFGAVMTARIVARDMELARLKSDFVSTVSHEFRSPLTSIRQLAEMLRSGRVPSEERRTQYYDVILEQSERLTLLVSNILDLARIDEGHFTFHRVRADIGELLDKTVKAAQLHCAGHDGAVTLTIDGPLPLVFVDPEAFSHIMSNLIDNAIKYSGPSAQVSVTARTDNTDLVIAVADCGPGIPQDATEKIFERFYRGGDEFTRRVKGSGLGLSLVRELVEAHDGLVDVDSSVGKGSVFTVRLPMAQGEVKDSG